jgi:antitoxin component YwqK of YwqJK toxin-antitoxin module
MAAMRTFLILALCAMPTLGHAIQVCELDGQFINPANGHTTAGKTGLMRCREGEGGPLVREQELKNGVFMGLVRYHKDGELQREHSVNERGNRDGRSREFTGKQVVSEETYRNGTTIGLSRRWHPNGKLRRVGFHGEDGREQAVAEFTPQGQLRELRCAAQPQLAPDADDATWCGHRSSPASVVLHAEDGKPRGSLVHERGERRKSELLWDNGKPREQIETSAGGGVERSFSETGVKRRERQWVVQGTRRSTTLEREYHESGTLVRERQWTPTERGGELALEQRWYLNGQLKEKQAYQSTNGQATRRDTFFHDNGRPSSEGLWVLAGRYDNQASGVHKRYDSEGRLRLERHHDAKGRVTRERELDESGQVTRDDELFEDGSRKAFQAR